MYYDFGSNLFFVHNFKLNIIFFKSIYEMLLCTNKNFQDKPITHNLQHIVEHTVHFSSLSFSTHIQEGRE